MFKLNVSFKQAEVVAFRLSTPLLPLILLSIYWPSCCNGRSLLAEHDSAFSSPSNEERVSVVRDINNNILRHTKAIVADFLDVVCKWGQDTKIRKATKINFYLASFLVSGIDHLNIRAQNSDIKPAKVETELADHYFI